MAGLFLNFKYPVNNLIINKLLRLSVSLVCAIFAGCLLFTNL